MMRKSTPPTPQCAHTSLRRQSGQSTVEFVVLALVMVPLLLIVPLIGKYMDIAQTTAIASRYVAFEGSVRHSSSTNGWKTDAELAQEVRRRFFSNSDAPVKTNDTAGNFNAHRNTLWFDHKGNPVLPVFENDVAVTTSKDHLDWPNSLVPTFANGFGLSKANLYTGRVQVNLASVAGLKPFDTLGLSMQRSTTVLVDPWAASGPAMVRSKIQAATAAFPYDVPFGLKDTSTAIRALGLPYDKLETNHPNIGAVEPDIVPTDRLK